MNSPHKAVPEVKFDSLKAEDLNRTIGSHLHIEKQIGVGGMGAVYQAIQSRLGRKVAVKILPSLPSTPEWNFEERFVMEARAMARLDHPNIVKIHDFGETENKLPYIVMEYVEGVDLGELVFGKLITVEHVGSWIPQVCEALEYAHNHELVHRDVKPANIMITLDGEVKIMDFGLVKMRGGPGSAGLTEARMSVGTPRYLAPEAVESGAHVDHRADIYSVGVVLYELLTGAPPSGAWRPPSALFPFLDPRLDAVVVRALQPEPNDRYSRVIDLGREVLDILTGSSSGQRRLLTQGGTGPRALNCPNPTPRDQGHSVLGGLQP